MVILLRLSLSLSLLTLQKKFPRLKRKVATLLVIGTQFKAMISHYCQKIKNNHVQLISFRRQRYSEPLGESNSVHVNPAHQNSAAKHTEEEAIVCVRASAWRSLQWSHALADSSALKVHLNRSLCEKQVLCFT